MTMPPGHENAPPIMTPSRRDDTAFLVGAERSGTTMLRLMLAHHPLLAWQNEFEFAVDLISSDGSFPDLGRYRQWLSTHRIFLATRFTIDLTLDYAELMRSFLEQRRIREGKPFVGATVHRHFDRVLRIWPKARFIHLVRDPRDVTRSVIAMGWAGNFWTGVRNWMEAELLWDHLCMVVPPERRYEVRYEELLADPERVLSGICVFLGAAYDPAMLSYPQHTTYDPPDPTLAYQWKRKLSRLQIRLVESRIGELLTRRGYESSGLPPLTVGVMRRMGLRVQDRVSRSTFRLRRFGVGLTLAHAVSSRVGPASWHRACAARINAIVQSQLK